MKPVEEIYRNIEKKLEKNRNRFENDLFSAKARRKDIFLSTYAYFIKIEDLMDKKGRICPK